MQIVPQYKVTFPVPVVYQADNRKARREVTDLIVHAPNEAGAVLHAMRVVQGEIPELPTCVLHVPEADLPLIEDMDDDPITVSQGSIDAKS